MRVRSDGLHDLLMRRGGDDAVGDRDDAVIHLLHQQAMEIQEIARDVQLGERSRSIHHHVLTRSDPREQQGRSPRSFAWRNDGRPGRIGARGIQERIQHRFFDTRQPVSSLQFGYERLARRLRASHPLFSLILHTRVIMPHFQYTLIGDGPDITFDGAAVDEKAARQEAVGFLADLLRDLALSGGQGSRLRVEARAPDGRLVCAVAADLQGGAQATPDLGY